MIVVRDYPPLIEEIVAAFPLARGPGVIFCWGDRIFAPRSPVVPLNLIAHEEVHSRQQDGDPEAWWRRYIADVDFRLAQEIPAHIAELRFHWRDPHAKRRRMYLGRVAGKLCAPLYRYGKRIDYHTARALLQAAMAEPLD